MEGCENCDATCGACSGTFDSRHRRDNCRRCVVRHSQVTDDRFQPWSMKLVVAVAVGQVLLGGVLLAAGEEVAAGAALTMGLWMLGRTMSK
jgi:hypothetical protein